MAFANEVSPLSSYAAMMVPIDLGSNAGSRARFACQLADQFSSHLIGVAAEAIIPPMYYEGVVAADASIVTIEEKRVAENLEKARKLFHDVAGTRSKIEWRSAVGMPTAFVNDQARVCDLLILSRQGADDADQGALSVRANDLVMEVGRPILVVPPEKDRVSLNRVVVAWKDTREARRAIWDSLPFLKRADAVFVVAVGPRGRSDSLDDVVAYLARHGIASRASMLPAPEGSVAEELLDFAEEEGGDLIVSGAYGHSRAREWIFGGVTHDLLNGTTICCLLSH